MKLFHIFILFCEEVLSLGLINLRGRKWNLRILKYIRLIEIEVLHLSSSKSIWQLMTVLKAWNGCAYKESPHSSGLACFSFC